MGWKLLPTEVEISKIRFGWVKRRRDLVWNGRRYEICLGDDRIEVTCFAGWKGWDALWIAEYMFKGDEYRDVQQEETMSSKWIAGAVAATTQVARVAGLPDGVLFHERPALWDFMTELTHEDGKGREPSVLMIACSAVGVRVGLKDETAGGWLWREGESLQDALDAIESTLQKGSVQWAVPGGKGRGKR